MRRFTHIMIAAIVVLSSATLSRAFISRHDFLAAADRSCPHCQPYIQVLRQIKTNPSLAENMFIKRRKLFLPGAKNRHVAKKLALRTLKLYEDFYSYLAHGRRPGNPAALVQYTLDSRISGDLRSSAAWLLYLTTHKPDYVVTALKLHYFEIRIFEYTKDPQFPLILSKLIEEISSNPKATHAKPLSATTSLRFEYARFVDAALFQGVPKNTRIKLFMLYRRLVVAGPGISGWFGRDLAAHEVPLFFALSPKLAPVVVKKIRPFGRPPLMEFLRALARQGMVKDLSQVVRTLPAEEGTVKSAVSQVLAQSNGQLRKDLTNFLKDPLAASVPPVRRRPSGIPVTPATPVPSSVVPTHTPHWLSIKTDVIRVKVLPAQEFATAIFKLRDKSNQSVDITRIWTSCSCTTAASESKQIKSGHSTKVTGRIRLAGLPLPLTRYVYLQVELDGHPDTLHILRLEIKAKTHGQANTTQ